MRQLNLAALRANAARGGVDAVVGAATGMSADATHSLFRYCHVPQAPSICFVPKYGVHVVNTQNGIVANCLSVFKQANRHHQNFSYDVRKGRDSCALLEFEIGQGGKRIRLSIECGKVGIFPAIAGPPVQIRAALWAQTGAILAA